MNKISLILALFVAFNYDAFSQDGSLDLTFDSGHGAYAVSENCIQPDGKIIITGNFTSYDSIPRARLARLLNDGSLDLTFDPGSGANDAVTALVLQPDGKILIGGNFTNVGGFNFKRIARLNADGSVDTTFNPGTGANAWVRTIAIQDDGKIILAGLFTIYNGIGCRVARLLPDGTFDASFNAPTTFTLGSGINALNIQSDGKIIIAGDFNAVNGNPTNRILRLDTLGLIDNTFNAPSFINYIVYACAIQNDGKIIIGGAFTTFIKRLNVDGTLDLTFITSNPNDFVHSITLQSDGKIIVGGEFTMIGSSSRNRIARLLSTGGLDPDFDPGSGANSYVFDSSIQTDGKILISGYFSSYNGISRKGIARLNVGTLSVTENHSVYQNLFLYPNPASSFTKILMPDNNNYCEVDIYNSLGSRIKTLSFLNDETLQLELNYPKGIYFILLRTGETKYSSKLVIE